MLVGIMALCTGALAGELPEILPIAAVTRGQLGVGKTVVSGTAVEEFAVEVLGVVQGRGPSNSLVLVRTSGPLIERTGGIAAGMSGSPVYVDGQLLGALAFGFDLADHTLGLVTPATDMAEVQALLDSAAGKGPTGSEPTSPLSIMDGGRLDGVVLASNQFEAAVWRSKVPQNVAVAFPVAAPLMVSGLGARTRSALESATSRWNMLTVPAGQAPEGVVSPEFEPGSSFGVQLVRGDVNLTALGTVTLVGDRGFVGFGHPFLNRGRVDYFVTGAYVHEVVQSIVVPFKVGAPLEAVGRLVQDRASGVGGVLGEDPEYVSVQVQVHDRTLGRVSELEACVVHDEGLTVPLAAVTLLEALDRGLDRIGKGTARTTVTLEGKGLTEPLVRDNIFFSNSDVSAAALGELLLSLQRLLGNEFSPVTLSSIKLAAEIGEERETARIERAVPQAREVAPGDTLQIAVTLRPFREEPITRSMSLTIPSDAVPGEVSVVVRPGGYGAPRLVAGEIAAQLETPEAPEEDDDQGAPSAVASLGKFLETLFESDHNYDIVAEYYPLPKGEALMDGLLVKGQEKSQSLATAAEKATLKQDKVPKAEEWFLDRELEPVKVCLPTPYYIQGSTTFPLQIVRRDLDRMGNGVDEGDTGMVD